MGRWTKEETELVKNTNLSHRDCANLLGKSYHSVIQRRRRLNIVLESSTSKKLENLKLVIKDHCPKCNNNALFYNEETGLYLCTLCKTKSYWYELN